MCTLLRCTAGVGGRSFTLHLHFPDCEGVVKEDFPVCMASSVLVLPAGFAGSRSGALIASAWASLMHQGQEGYQAITKKLMEVGLHMLEL